MEQMAQNRMHRIYRQCLRTVAVAVTVTMKGNSSQNRMCQMLHLLVTVIGVPNANVVCIKHNFVLSMKFDCIYLTSDFCQMKYQNC